VAIVAVALALADVDPIVITIGQPPAVVDLPCDAIDHGIVYRFANSRAGLCGPTYDPVPGLSNRARHIGHQIMLSDDATGVAYIGLDSETTYSPFDVANGFAVDVGYIARIQGLVRPHSSHEGNVRSNGFTEGTSCSQDVEYASGSCHRRKCR
jgi:hypothetical protein